MSLKLKYLVSILAGVLLLEGAVRLYWHGDYPLPMI